MMIVETLWSTKRRVIIGPHIHAKPSQPDWHASYKRKECQDKWK